MRPQTDRDRYNPDRVALALALTVYGDVRVLFGRRPVGRGAPLVLGGVPAWFTADGYYSVRAWWLGFTREGP